MDGIIDNKDTILNGILMFCSGILMFLMSSSVIINRLLASIKSHNSDEFSKKIAESTAFRLFVEFMASFDSTLKILASLQKEPAVPATKEDIENGVKIEDDTKFPKQNNPELLPEIQRYGCYLLALLKGLMGDRINTPQDVNECYNHLILIGAISENCYIKDNNAIAKQITGEDYDYEYGTKNQEFPNASLIAGKYINAPYEHFVIVKRVNDGYVCQDDSLSYIDNTGKEVFSKTVNMGHLDSIRVFTKKIIK